MKTTVKRLAYPTLAMVLLSGCAATSGALTAAGDAVQRARGIEPQTDQNVAPAAENDDPHWSETWVWEGDS